jgi:oligogalacturonide lyase
MTFRDQATGTLVRQITHGNAISHPTYFLQSSFFPGDRGLFFTSYRSGSAQLYEAGYPEGPVRALTAGAAIHPFSPALSRDGEEIVFVRGGSVWAIRSETRAERLVADFEGGQVGEPSLSSDNWFTAAFRKGDLRGVVVGRLDGTETSLIPFPRTVIHPQFHPLEPEWIEFAGDPASRMHRVRRDGSGLECLYQHDNNEFVVHETFLGETGDLVFTIWPRALYRMDWTTREIRQIAAFNAWHIAPNRAGDKILCDTNHPDIGLQIVEVATGNRRPVCLSASSNQGTQWRKSSYALAEDFAAARSTAKSTNLSWMETDSDTVYGPQWSHPHPSWSSDETKVAFASDRTGVAQVYVAELQPGYSAGAV